MSKSTEKSLLEPYNSAAGTGYIFLSVILAAYVVMVIIDYLAFPPWSDNIWYTMQVYSPEKLGKLIFRSFNYYVTKIFIGVFPSKLQGCAFFSTVYHLGIIALSYLSVFRISGKLPAMLAAMLTTTFPVMLFEATLYGPDAPCMFFGLLAIYLSLSLHVNTRYPYLEIFFAGFFMIGTLFSKETGIVFLFPVFLILFSKLSKKVFFCFFGGMACSLLFLAVCDQIWLGEFFYHFDFSNYLSFSGKCVENLRHYINLSGVMWNPTFFEKFKGGGNIQYLIYIAIYLTLFSVPTSKEFQKKKYLSFALFLVAVISIVFHEFLHVRNTMLQMHYRWMYTSTIPFILSFCTLLPYSSSHEKNGLRISRYMSIALAITFTTLFFITRRKTSFYDEFITQWQLSNSLFHVFSFWFFLLGAGMMLFYGFRVFSENQSRIRYMGLFLGVAIIIWYSTSWSHITAYEEFKSIAARVEERKAFSSFFKIQADKTLVLGVERVKHAEDSFKLMLCDGTLKPTTFKEIMQRAGLGVNDKDIFDILRNASYKYLLLPTQQDIDVLIKQAANHYLLFERVEEVKYGFCYKIVNIKQ